GGGTPSPSPPPPSPSEQRQEGREQMLGGRGQLRLAYVASEANTADIFTKALAPGDHQRFCTLLGFPTCTQHSVSSSFLFLHRLKLSYCPTSEMAADYLTKKLGKSKFEYCMLLTGQSHVTCSDTPEAKGSVGNNHS
ncbi:unnamed protein product, partial [Closterium sp. NIES-54]